MSLKKEPMEKRFEEFRERIQRDLILSSYTSLRIGGKADYLFIPSDSLDLIRFIEVLGEMRYEYLVLGGGTNLLIMDNGLDEVVVSLKNFQEIKIVEERGDRVYLSVQAGVPLQTLIQFCAKKGLSGLEGLICIPGSVGGALCGNSGAYGCEIMNTVERASILSRGKISILGRDDVNPTYRHGGFPEQGIILGAHLALQHDDINSVKGRMDHFFSQKKTSQPIGERSAGCVFRNPGAESAGRLMDEAGCKGLRVGDIEVSRVHANFFLNKGNGTAKDFLSLMDRVSSKVYQIFGVTLEPEIKIVGKL
jgi:UDP-N-acetylmuramate dehydrogenase